MYVHIQAKGTSLENCYSRLVLFDCYNADYVNWFSYGLQLLISIKV